jgi:MarR family transcriptional regulator, transcriptional regulator for hemolysin
MTMLIEQPARSKNLEFGFLISDVARLLKTYSNRRAEEFGMTRAQWAVLFRLERHEGMIQSELAAILDIEPITLARIVDKLAEQKLVERRSDPKDRRAWRLHLTENARPVLERLHELGEDIMASALSGIDDETLAQLVGQLNRVKENLKEQLKCP